MKALLTFLVSMFCYCSFAQSLLPQDDKGLVAFTEVVKTDSLDEKLLYANAKTWFISKGYQINSSSGDSLAGKLSAVNGFYVYAKRYLTKKIHGKITYTTTIEVKKGKYRYVFNNFVFHYYKEDRTLKMAPSGKEKPLEEQKASGWQPLWDSHKKLTKDNIDKYIKELKLAMVELPKLKTEPVISKKSTTTDW